MQPEDEHMLRHTLVIGLTCIGLAACGQPITRQDRAVEQQRVQDRVAGWARAFSNRDRDSLASFYDTTPQFTFAWADGRRTSGWEDESKAQQEFFANVTQTNLVLQDVTVEVFSPTVALATFRHSADFIVGGSGGNPARNYFTGLGTMVWTKPDPKGLWVLHAGQLSATPPPPAPAGPAGRRRG
jgi:ketosteroid isomerase-like protein